MRGRLQWSGRVEAIWPVEANAGAGLSPGRQELNLPQA